MSAVFKWMTDVENALLRAQVSPQLQKSTEYFSKGWANNFTAVRNSFWFAFQTCSPEELSQVRIALDEANDSLGLVMFENGNLDMVMNQLGNSGSIEKLRAVLPRLTASEFIHAGGINLAGLEPNIYLHDMLGWPELMQALTDEDLSTWKRSIEQTRLTLQERIEFLKKVPNPTWTVSSVCDAYEESLSCFLSDPSTFTDSCILLHEGYGFKYPTLGFREIMKIQGVLPSLLEARLPQGSQYPTVSDDRLLAAEGSIPPSNIEQQKLLDYFQIIDSLNSHELLLNFCIHGAQDTAKVELALPQNLQLPNY